MNADDNRRSWPEVIDCLGHDFQRACHELATLVCLSSTPDLWLGVETGGGFILRAMVAAREVKQSYAFVSASRPKSKQRRSKLTPKILALLPRGAANFLRSMEHLARERKFRKFRRVSERNVVFLGHAADQIRHAKVIVLIDDAIDSGSSIVQIRNAIYSLNAYCTVLVAVIAQTFNDPLVHPDFLLLNNKLVRFPWSADSPT